MDDDANYHHPTKPFSSNRRSSHYLRPPPPTRYDVDDDVIDDDLDEEMAEQPYNNHYPNPNRSFDADNGWEWHPKKRKLKILDHSGSGYELAPRGRNPGCVETDHAVFVLLEVWGDRFLQLGRKSLMSEDWGDVAAKVSEELKTETSEKECRGMLDMLKRRYMKEKARIENGGGGVSRWGHYKKMDMLMEGSTRQELGLACGVDNGEYVFMNTRVYLEKSNGVDEMMDSPGESESDEDDDEEEENENVGRFNGFGFVSPREGGGQGGGGEGSYRVLAESIQKFGEIYESIESSKRQQMMELEKMRREVNREMEAQKKEILERAQVEIAKIQEAADGDGEDDEEEEEDSEEASAEELTE